MKHLGLLLLLATTLPALPTRAQSDSLPAVVTVLPQQWGGQSPFISPFCKEVVWFDGLPYSISTRRFLTEQDTATCFPAAATRIAYGSSPQYPRFLWWTPDPYTGQYCWTAEYRNDTLVIWRYDVGQARQDRFFTQYQANEYLVGQAGIWLSHNQELILVDRHSGQVLHRHGTPDSTARYSLDLRNWGDDVLLGDRRMYKRAQQRYEDFFPLPADMKECRSPEKMQFQTEVCGSWYWENEERQYAYFLSTPTHPPLALPFKLVTDGSAIERQILASNPPLTWFYFPDRVLAYNIYTGDSVVYPGQTGEPLIGDQNGRFLAFRSKLGLSFFDKETCQFRVLDLPYGFEWPRNFTCTPQYIFLTYEHQWKIVDFTRLPPVFQPSLVEAEYQVFEKEYSQLYTGQTEAFGVAYEKYLKLYNRYRNNQNPKIADSWDNAKAGLRMALFLAPDSVLATIVRGYYAGAYDLSISCELAQTIFNYHGYRGDLLEALHLLEINDNATCITEKSQYGQYCIDLLKTARFQLDSVQKVKQPKDQRLYALGKVWWDYCFNKRNFRYSYDPRGDFKQAYDYYRQLLKEYPQSIWADNAAYDTMYYIDYHATATDDETPDGSDEQAYAVFTQFLKDYPHSDRRPDVLLRLAGIVQRRLYESSNQADNQAELAAYMDSIAQGYPDFARTSDYYKQLATSLKTQAWASRWLLQVSTDRDVYKLTDTIRVRIQFYNQSKTSQSLDTTFLNHWSDPLYLHLYQERSQGCEDRSGDFPLLRENPLSHQQAITVAPGSSYGETFLLGHTSQVKSYGSRIFDLASGGRYAHYMEYYHPVMRWIRLQAAQGGKFKIE